MSIEKFAKHVDSSSLGNVLTSGSFGFSAFSYEIDLSLFLILLGTIGTLIGVIMQIKTHISTAKVNKTTEDLNNAELEQILLERKVLEKEHPEIFQEFEKQKNGTKERKRK